MSLLDGAAAPGAAGAGEGRRMTGHAAAEQQHVDAGRALADAAAGRAGRAARAAEQLLKREQQGVSLEVECRHDELRAAAAAG